MSQVKKTMAQGFADGKALYDFYTGIAQDIAKIPLMIDAGAVFVSSSGGTITLSSGHATRPAVGDLLILTTGTSTDTKTAAAVVVAASSAATTILASAQFSTDIFSTAAINGFLVRFSVLGSSVTTST